MLSAVLVALVGCSTVGDRDKGPIGQMQNLISKDELQDLYKKHGFGTKEAFKTGPNKPSPELRRNELQNVLLGMSTQKCTDFKTRLATKLKRDSFRFGLGAELFSVAGASISHGLTATALAATGASASTLGKLHDTTYHVASVNVALSGIARARTRVFLNIKDSMAKGLLDYPVARAVNDAFRYHSVCSLADGMIEASRAANSMPNVPSSAEQPTFCYLPETSEREEAQAKECKLRMDECSRRARQDRGTCELDVGQLESGKGLPAQPLAETVV